MTLGGIFGPREQRIPLLMGSIPAQIPLSTLFLYPEETWPFPPDTLFSACGIEWDLRDIRRFISFCQPSGSHVMWGGAWSRGQGNSQKYGSFHTKGKTVRAHKFSGVAILGLRPGKGEDLDHKCHTTLCVRCLQVLTKQQNRDRIRRPDKRILDLAKFCSVTPAELMSMPDAKIDTFERMMYVAQQIEAGRRPPGVLYDGPRKKGKK